MAVCVCGVDCGHPGLTGGSVPRDTLCDRPTVILSARRLTATTLSPDASKVLCFAGAGIFDLKEQLAVHGRAAHTELGSIFLNPSVGAGVAFGSGGTQLRVRARPMWATRVSASARSLKSSSHSQLESVLALLTRSVTIRWGCRQVGPAYTERVLYCSISPKGKVELVDSLGIKPSTRGEGVRTASFPVPPRAAWRWEKREG